MIIFEIQIIKSGREVVSLIIKSENIESNPNALVMELPNKAGSLSCL